MEKNIELKGELMGKIDGNILDIIGQQDIDMPRLIELLFRYYVEKKKNKRLYSIDDYIPQNLIKMYYGACCHLDFDVIVDSFKRKYIYNENQVENVREQQERMGLGVVYDFIMGDEWQKIDNIYIICKIHQLLYSKVPNLEFGGTFRNVNSFVTNGGYNIAIDYSLIPRAIADLFPIYKELVEFANQVNESKDTNALIEYINKCVDLKCQLIKIHPFADGNGRTSRALVNVFFKRVKLPPVFIEAKEKEEYIDAMDRAIRCDDYIPIRRFYYYKICDSIVELDINNKNKESENTKPNESEAKQK